MKKGLLIVIGVLVIIAAGALLRHGPKQSPVSNRAAPSAAASSPLPADYKNATYTINNEDITLINGHAETDVDPGSASKSITLYLGMKPQEI